MSILDIFKSKKVLDSSPAVQNDIYDSNVSQKAGMGGINYIDSHAYEIDRIDISQITPLRTFDNMPHNLAGIAYKNYSSWQNYAASVGSNNSLQQYSQHILNRLSYQECANLATDSMISKAVDVITRELFKSGGRWINSHLDIDNFEMILNSLNFYNKIRLGVQRALEYGGAFLYINTDDTDLSLPLYLNERTASTNKITGLTVIEPWQAAPVQVNSFNPLKENYMEPELWWVLGASSTVHKTRLIPVVFYSVPDLIKPLYNYLGLPLSFYMKNYVSNADTVRQSISDLVLRFRTKIIKTTAQKIADPQTQARVKYMNATSNNLATLLLAKDEEWIETVTSLSGMDNLLSQMYELMTASTRGIPVTKLLGLSPRGFNATGEYDENNFYDVIDGYSQTVVVPVMERLAEYILCFKAGILSEPKYEFNPRKQIRPKEQAEINNLKADYISKLIMSGVIAGRDAIKAISEDNFKFDWIDMADYKVPENPEVEQEMFNKFLDEWKESEHKRDENGRFAKMEGAKNSGGPENNNKELETLIKKRDILIDEWNKKYINFRFDDPSTWGENITHLSHKERVDKVLAAIKKNGVDLEKYNISISENRFGQTSVYLTYKGYRIRISDHMNSDYFNTANYRLSISDIEDTLPGILEIIDTSSEINKIRAEEAKKARRLEYEQKKESRQNKRASEASEVEAKAKEYMELHKDFPYQEELKKLVDKAVKWYMNGSSSKLKLPDSKERYRIKQAYKEKAEKDLPQAEKNILKVSRMALSGNNEYYPAPTQDMIDKYGLENEDIYLNSKYSKEIHSKYPEIDYDDLIRIIGTSLYTPKAVEAYTTEKGYQGYKFTTKSEKYGYDVKVDMVKYPHWYEIKNAELNKI